MTDLSAHDASTQATAAVLPHSGQAASVRDYFELLKPRVMTLVVFTAFVGLWIARDADSKNFSRILQAPILLATFMAGPLGLFIWLIVREGRARAQGRFS